MAKITIWNEFLHEQSNDACGDLCRKHYPKGIHAYLKKALGPALEDCTIRAVSLDMPENGLPDKVLDATDVLVWWGHVAHDKVPDALVDRIQRRVLGGMGLVVLHSGHMSKIFRRMLGAPCTLRWREIGERLKISPKTVQTHREHIKEKLGLKTSAELGHSAWTWRRAQE